MFSELRFYIVPLVFLAIPYSPFPSDSVLAKIDIWGGWIVLAVILFASFIASVKRKNQKPDTPTSNTRLTNWRRKWK